MVVDRLYYAEAKEVSSEFTFDSKFMADALKNIYEQSFNPMSEVETKFFYEFWDKLNFGVDFGLSKVKGVDIGQDFVHALKYNNGVFAAFKTHRLQNDVAALLVDSKGVRRPFKEWLKEAAPIADHQCNDWFKTEYTTAINRANQAAEWKEFEAHSDVLPNLEWLPSTAPSPRELHRQFYGLILPINHQFWNEHKPGDLWNCQCALGATDAKCTSEKNIPVKLSKPAEGLDGNPANDGKLFSDTHPYVKHANKGASTAVAQVMQNQIRARMKELRREAKPLTKKTFKRSDVGLDMTISNKGVKEWLNQPHTQQYIKNELLLDLDNLMKSAKYIGKGVDKHNANVEVHLFEVDIMSAKSWVIVREHKGVASIYSISDSPSIVDKIKK